MCKSLLLKGHKTAAQTRGRTSLLNGPAIVLHPLRFASSDPASCISTLGRAFFVPTVFISTAAHRQIKRLQPSCCLGLPFHKCSVFCGSSEKKLNQTSASHYPTSERSQRAQTAASISLACNRKTTQETNILKK